MESNLTGIVFKCVGSTTNCRETLPNRYPRDIRFEKGVDDYIRGPSWGRVFPPFSLWIQEWNLGSICFSIPTTKPPFSVHPLKVNWAVWRWSLRVFWWSTTSQWILSPFEGDLFWSSRFFSVIFMVKSHDVFGDQHPWRLTWNIIMEVWKIIFLSKWVICRWTMLIFQGENVRYLQNPRRGCLDDVLSFK